MVPANNTDAFSSSDDDRGAGPLTHALSATFDSPFSLQRGGSVPGVTVVYETYGRLNAAKSNAVLICHAVSGDSHVCGHDEQDHSGWWDIAVGPGKCIDTDKYFVICPNALGGCRGTTGPNSTNPDTGRPYGPDFPVITVKDIVEVQLRLIDHLGIDKLLAVVGGSLGGHQALCWGAGHSDRVEGVIAVAASARLSSLALAFDIIGRNAITQDPNFNGGRYYDRPVRPDVGLAIARMIGHISYLSPQALDEKFDATRYQPRDVPVVVEKRFSIGSYLGYQGAKFVERFDANSYIALSMAMDLFDLGATKEELVEALKAGTSHWLLISFTSDWLFTAGESQTLVDALIATNNKPVSYCNVHSDSGHDAFLLPDALKRYGALIAGFLANLIGEAPAGDEAGAEDQPHSPTSIFHPAHPHRLDYDRITDLIDPSESVLDLGCGNGWLLTCLRDHGCREIVGVDIDQDAVIACVRKGLPVIHADLNEGLRSFGDGQFGVVVLSQTLQTVKEVEGLVDEMLRVGRKCIVSFPNFGYHKHRKILAEQGRAPETPGLLHYKWYNTPNIRVLSIADFEMFCLQKGIAIHRRVTLDTEDDGREVTDDPNLNADLAIFVISR